jgi:predicted DNA-binding transcriptional regulator YafY
LSASHGALPDDRYHESGRWPIDVPVEGEAGVGYIRRGFDVPPLMFTREETEALAVGARMVETWTTDQLSAAAHQALEKIEAALPLRRR